MLIVNLGAPFRIRAGADIEAAEYADGCVVTTPTRAWEFGYPPQTRSVGVHFKPWGLAPFLPMPAAELCDRPVTVEEVWGRAAVAELRDRLATADGPHEMLTLLEEELVGVTPKRLARTYRFTATVFSINPAEPVDWGTLAADAGYADQAHFGHEFREFTGITPTQYLEVRRRFLREHPGHSLEGWPLPAV